MFFKHIFLYLQIFLFYHKTITKTLASRPHVIIFVADDLGWDDVSFHGSTQLRTPNIDALAADGIILNNFYASPICTPSRGALLSGVHPIHSGTQHYVIGTAEPWGLPLNIKLMPQYLRQLGYATHAVGKWHLGFFRKDYLPTNRGFDSHYGYWNGAEDYFDHTTLEDKMYWGIDFRDNLDLATNVTGQYSTHLFTDRALQLIHDHDSSQPLFLYVAYQAVHGANHYARLQAPQEYIDMFPNINNTNRRIFAAMAYAMDESIGRIFGGLHERGFLQNSIVLFTSDNGGPASGFTGNAACNWPLRGIKQTLWEGGVRVPALIWSPLLKKMSYVSNALMHITDFLPTILDAIDADVYNHIDYTHGPVYGISMWSTLSNNYSSGPRVDLLHNIDPIWNTSALRMNKWKLVQGLVYPSWAGWYPPLGQHDHQTEDNENENETFRYLTDCEACRVLLKMDRKFDYKAFLENNKQKLIVNCGVKPVNASTNCKPDIKPCLYNIEEDPCEYNNLADQYPDIVNVMWEMIKSFNSTALPPANKPTDPRADPKLHDYTWTFWDDPDTIM